MSATAYISRDDAEAYFVDLYGDLPAAWSSATSDAKTYALRRATRWLDITFEGQWKGQRTATAIAQGTSWPRRGVYDNDGNPISDATTPDAVRNACAEAAKLDLAGELDSVPDREASSGRIVEREVSAGSVSKRVRYAGGVSEAASAGRSFPLIDGILRDLIEGSDGTVEHVF